MSPAGDKGGLDEELYDREVPEGRDLISRFPIRPGIDGISALHRWLDDLKSAGTIAAWYDGESISDVAGTEAVIEFETTLERGKALALWTPNSRGRKALGR